MSDSLRRAETAKAFVTAMRERGIVTLDCDAFRYHLALLLRPEGHPTIDGVKGPLPVPSVGHVRPLTPRYVSADDIEAAKERKYLCAKGCQRWFVVRDRDYQERPDGNRFEGFYRCPCGVDLVVALSGESRLGEYESDRILAEERSAIRSSEAKAEVGARHRWTRHAAAMAGDTGTLECTQCGVTIPDPAFACVDEEDLLRMKGAVSCQRSNEASPAGHGMRLGCHCEQCVSIRQDMADANRWRAQRVDKAVAAPPPTSAQLLELSPLDRAHAFCHALVGGRFSSTEAAIQLLSGLLPYEKRTDYVHAAAEVEGRIAATTRIQTRERCAQELYDLARWCRENGFAARASHTESAARRLQGVGDNGEVIDRRAEAAGPRTQGHTHPRIDIHADGSWHVGEGHGGWYRALGPSRETPQEAKADAPRPPRHGSDPCDYGAGFQDAIEQCADYVGSHDLAQTFRSFEPNGHTAQRTDSAKADDHG